MDQDGYRKERGTIMKGQIRKLAAWALSLAMLAGLCTAPVFAASGECVPGGSFDSADDLDQWSLGNSTVDWIEGGGPDGSGCIRVVPQDKAYIGLTTTTTLEKDQWYISSMKVKLLPNPDGSRAEADAKMMLMQAYNEDRTITKVNSDEWTEVYGCFKYMKGEDTAPLHVRVGQAAPDTIRYGAYIDDVSIVPFGGDELITGGDFEDYHVVLSTSSYSDSDRYGNNAEFRCDPFVGVAYANRQPNSWKIQWMEGGQNGNETGHILMTPQPNTWMSWSTAEVIIEPQQWYKLSVRAKLAGSDQNTEVKFRIECVGSEETGSTKINPEDGWKEICTYFKYNGAEPVGQQLQMRIGQGGGVPNGGIYLDDWKLEKVGTEDLINADFESSATFADDVATGTFNPWVPGSKYNVSYTTEESYTGVQSLKFINGDTVRQTKTFTAGELYEFQSAVKIQDMAPAGGNSVYASLYCGSQLMAKKKLEDGWNVLRAFSDEVSGENDVYTAITVEDGAGNVINQGNALTYYLDSTIAGVPKDIVLNGDFAYDSAMWEIAGESQLAGGALTVTPTEDMGSLSQNIRLPQGDYAIQFNISEGAADFALGDILSQSDVGGEYVTTFSVRGDQECVLSFTGDSAFTVDDIQIQPYAPQVEQAGISGYMVAGDTVFGEYTYAAAVGYPAEGMSKYQWLLAKSVNADQWQTLAEGYTTEGEGTALLLEPEYIGQYVRLVITPVDENGIEGMPVRSAANRVLKRFDITSSFTGNLTGGESFGFQSEIHNNTGEAETLTVMLAVYDETGRMCGAAAQKETIPSGETRDFAKSIPLTGGQSARILYWYGDEAGVTDMRIVDDYLEK